MFWSESFLLYSPLSLNLSHLIHSPLTDHNADIMLLENLKGVCVCVCLCVCGG